MDDLPIVLDVGTNCKAGFGGNASPTSVFPSIIGRPRSQRHRASLAKDHYVGEAALNEREFLVLKYPVEHGIITNWDDMEKIFHHTFYDLLQVPPEEHPVLITDFPVGPKAPREKMVQIMFETFNVPAMFIGFSAVLALYATGRTNGMVLDSGDGVSYIVPVYEGYWLPHATHRIDIGGRDTTDYMLKLLHEKYNNFNTIEKCRLARQIKEKFCYTASNFQEEMERISSSSLYGASYTLPDGKVIELGSERFKVPEVMFDPKLLGRECQSFPEVLDSSIKKIEKKLRATMYENIVLAGGNTLFHDFPNRLEQELTSLAFFKTKIKIVAPPERRYLGWLGGSVLTSLSSFSTQWMSKEEYDENGPSFVHRKCV